MTHPLANITFGHSDTTLMSISSYFRTNYQFKKFLKFQFSDIYLLSYHQYTVVGSSFKNCAIFQAVNLSFQELGHPYQLKQFLVVLQKLIRCESLQLMDNGLTDLSSIYLPRYGLHVTALGLVRAYLMKPDQCWARDQVRVEKHS